jgi:hypothetical protein
MQHVFKAFCSVILSVSSCQFGFASREYYWLNQFTRVTVLSGFNKTACDQPQRDTKLLALLQRRCPNINLDSDYL